MADLIGDRPITTCAICTQTDDHPKHSVLLDPAVGWSDLHLDCHADRTGCEDCTRRLAGADGATGAALLDHLLAPATTTPED